MFVTIIRILEQYRRIYKVRLANAREIRKKKENGRKNFEVHLKKKQLRNASKLNNIIYNFTYKL